MWVRHEIGQKILHLTIHMCTSQETWGHVFFARIPFLAWFKGDHPFCFGAPNPFLRPLKGHSRGAGSECWARPGGFLFGFLRGLGLWRHGGRGLHSSGGGHGAQRGLRAGHGALTAARSHAAHAARANELWHSCKHVHSCAQVLSAGHAGGAFGSTMSHAVSASPSRFACEAAAFLAPSCDSTILAANVPSSAGGI